MNFLAHIYLSGTEEDVIIGNFIADGIKGRSYLEYPEGIQKGVLLHRFIDSFTDNHSTVRQSTARLHATYGHYSGVIVDILYDHYLARDWNRYHDQPLEDFVQAFYELLHRNFESLPFRTQRLLPYMIADNWLLSYATIDGIGKILSQMNVRTKGRSGMDRAVRDLEEHYVDFETEFISFFNELITESHLKLESL